MQACMHSSLEAGTALHSNRLLLCSLHAHVSDIRFAQVSDIRFAHVSDIRFAHVGGTRFAVCYFFTFAGLLPDLGFWVCGNCGCSHVIYFDFSIEKTGFPNGRQFSEMLTYTWTVRCIFSSIMTCTWTARSMLSGMLMLWGLRKGRGEGGGGNGVPTTRTENLKKKL